MGMNFYVRLSECPDPCEHCQFSSEVHLGKSSAGWTFSFRGYPHGGPGFSPVTDYESWTALALLGTIVDEHGEPISLEAMAEKIENKRGGKDELFGDDFLDPLGHRFTNAEFC